MTWESFGSITTQHIENDPMSSVGNTWCHWMPRLSVFHRPPNAEATNHVSGFFASITTSTTRPVTRPGPILRSRMFSNVAAVMQADPVAPCRAETNALANRAARATPNTALFMGLLREDTIALRILPL